MVRAAVVAMSGPRLTDDELFAKLSESGAVQQVRRATGVRSGQSGLEAQCALILRSLGVEYVEELTAIEGRAWRFDFAIPALRIAIECEGGTWRGGRHTRGAGFERDAQKYNAAAIAGWMVLRFTEAMLDSGEARQTIAAAVKRRIG